MIEAAIQNVQGHTALDHCQVNVLSVEAAEFPTASLYPAVAPVDEQTLTRGYILVLEGAGRIFTFHAAEERVVLVDVQP